jgi:hypothetical protein
VFVPLSSIERRFQNDHFTKTGSGQTQRKALHSKQKNAAYVLHAPFERTGDPGRLSEIQRPRPVRKMPPFFEFYPCLPRACLGKMIVFIYILLKNGGFRSGQPSGGLQLYHSRRGKEAKQSFFFHYSYYCASVLFRNNRSKLGLNNA